MVLVVKSPLAKAGDTGDMGSIPLLGRSPGEGKGNHSNILAWKIPWTKEPGRVQWGSKELDTTESLSSMVPFTLIVFQISSSLSLFFS